MRDRIGATKDGSVMRGRGFARVSTALAAPCGAIAIALTSLEIGLRFLPQVIPLAVLAEFPTELRTQLAHDRPVTTRDQMRAVVRDDGGPDLLIYRPSAEIHEYAPDAGMVGTVRLDTEGFCDPLPDSEGHASMVAVGDSFTFCTTVKPEDTWTAELGRRFRAHVEDLGVPRLGVFEYLEILKQVGLPKSPSVVVMNVYEGNDLRDAVLYWEARDNGGPSPLRAPGALRAMAALARESPVTSRSYAVSFLAGAVLSWSRPDETSALARHEGRHARDVNFRYRLEFGRTSIRFNPENGDRNEVVYADLLARGRVTLDVFAPALETFSSLARSHHFTPILTYTPSAHSAYGSFVRFEDPSLPRLMRRYSRAQRRYFARRAAELGLRFVDLTQPLRQAARTSRDGELLYFPTNLHLTAAGHRAIALALADVLAEHMMATPGDTSTPHG